VPTLSQTVQLKQVMRQRLAHAETLRGRRDEQLGSWLLRRALGQLTNDPAWAALKTPEYVRQSEGFVRATQDLVEAAENRDSEATPLAFVSLTLSCVRCHQYVARARIARIDRWPVSPQREPARLATVDRPH
jgi:hypothetical protein